MLLITELAHCVPFKTANLVLLTPPNVKLASLDSESGAIKTTLISFVKLATSIACNVLVTENNALSAIPDFT